MRTVSKNHINKLSKPYQYEALPICQKILQVTFAILNEIGQTLSSTLRSRRSNALRMFIQYFSFFSESFFHLIFLLGLRFCFMKYSVPFATKMKTKLFSLQNLKNLQRLDLQLFCLQWNYPLVPPIHCLVHNSSVYNYHHC